MDVPTSDPRLGELADRLADHVGDAPQPWLVGLAGGVAAGKSTLAAGLATQLGAVGEVATMSTDAFLLPNAELDRLGLGLRKGFPESYDWPALAAALDALQRGETVTVPVYSHVLYDIDPDASTTVEPVPWVIVEGVNALQRPLPYDARLYLHADEADARAWFTDRLRASIRDAAPGTFYAAMAVMDDVAVGAFADQVWEGINGVNLRDHIEPTRATADLVVHVDGAHRITAIDG